MRPSQAPDNLGMVIAGRINERLSALGKSPRAAALEAGLSEDTVRTLLRRPSTIPSVYTLLALAPVLQTSLNYLAAVADSPSDPRPQKTLPIRYAVAAGTWLEHDDTDQSVLENAPIGPHPEWPARSQFVVRVEGDSMSLVWPSGTLVRCVEVASLSRAPDSGARVLIERRRPGLFERSLKVLRTANDGSVEFWPQSSNPRFQTPLVVHAADLEEETEVAIVAIALDGLIR